MGLQGFERRLERLVEGAFARAFRSGLRPIELGRRVGRVLDNERTVDVRGRTAAPNLLLFNLSHEDADRFDSIGEGLKREIAEVAREHARERSYHFLGPIEVELRSNGAMRTGQFELIGQFGETADGLPPGTLVMSNGDRLRLGEQTVIGRLTDCDVVIDDPNVSRRHAQIVLADDRYTVRDLGSTNGVIVNGQRIAQHHLVDGDQLSFGNRTATFEAS